MFLMPFYGTLWQKNGCFFVKVSEQDGHDYKFLFIYPGLAGYQGEHTLFDAVDDGFDYGSSAFL